MAFLASGTHSAAVKCRTSCGTSEALGFTRPLRTNASGELMGSLPSQLARGRLSRMFSGRSLALRVVLTALPAAHCLA